MTDLARAERDLEQCRNAADASSFGGRSRTEAALAEVKRLREAEAAPGADERARSAPDALSDAEIGVINALVAAWNLFLHLPVEHPDAQTEFRFGIHSLQNMIFARPGIRTWNSQFASAHGDEKGTPND